MRVKNKYNNNINIFQYFKLVKLYSYSNIYLQRSEMIKERKYCIITLYYTSFFS